MKENINLIATVVCVILFSYLIYQQFQILQEHPDLILTFVIINTLIVIGLSLPLFEKLHTSKKEEN